jgi:hypothetical protein
MMIALVIVAAVEQCALHQMTHVVHEMTAEVVAVEERMHRATKSIASSPAAIEFLE